MKSLILLMAVVLIGGCASGPITNSSPFTDSSQPPKPKVIPNTPAVVAAVEADYEKVTVLDHTTVVMGSNFGDSSNHTCNNLPMIVAGGGHRHQAHTVLDGQTPLCNLYLELLHKHDIDAESFGSNQKDMGLLNS